MPKFTDAEKEIIYEKLRVIGESLFVKHGLKKVTINDIVEKADIGKGTFYHFYNNKEHLFMDIFNHIQQDLFAGVDQLLATEDGSKVKAFEIVRYLVQKFKEHPLLSLVSGDMYALMKCKVPEECLSQNDMDDLLLFQRAVDAGISFKYPPTIVTKVVQSIFIAAHAVNDDQDGQEIVDILIQSVVNQMVE